MNCYIVLYSTGFIASYYAWRFMVRYEAEEDYNYGMVFLGLFVSILSWVSALASIVTIIIMKLLERTSKPPKWL